MSKCFKTVIKANNGCTSLVTNIKARVIKNSMCCNILIGSLIQNAVS